MARAVLPELCPVVPRQEAGHSLAQVPPALTPLGSVLPLVSVLLLGWCKPTLGLRVRELPALLCFTVEQ